MRHSGRGVVNGTLMLGLASLVTVLALDAAQGPRAAWRTVETASFRVHYPDAYEPWALRVAGRLESIRARVAAETGYTPPQKTDVVVMDPVSEAGGFAIPVLHAPRMVLWATPPPADSVIGHYAGWGEMVAAHEDAHLAHTLRRSRNPLAGFLESTLLPVGPIARRSPRWVIEGYATVLEGQLTGFGRPHGGLRAAILRRWAQQGRLPPYERLSGDAERWQGMSMAYLAGSAYLEWLLDRGGPDSLRHVWARMTARTVRSFGEAFRGVFGDSPEALYGRFSAELTQRSMQAEQIIEPLRRDGVLWQRLEWSTGAPAVSPDGAHLAIVLYERDRPARLAVFATAPDEEAEREWRERIDRMLARDPEDVAPARIDPLPRRPVHVLPAMHGAEPYWPRWMPDGESILFARFEPDSEGFLHPDLFLWRPATGRVQRVTRFAGLHRPDPSPDGSWAAAVRHRYGASQLVRVDLATGAVDPFTPASVETVYDSPRVSPDGNRLAYLRNDGGGWRAVIRNLEDGSETALPSPMQMTLAFPAWSPDGRSLYMSAGQDGFIDIHAFPVFEPGDPRPVTRTHGAALAAAPAPSNRGVYFLSLEPHGLDLRFLEWETEAERFVNMPEPMPGQLVPAIPPPASAPPGWQVEPVEPGRAYGLGRQEFLPLVGGSYARSSQVFEAGLRGGDLLGRLNYIAIGSLPRRGHGPAGGAFGMAWRGWPVTVRAHLFSANERPSLHEGPPPGIAADLDVRRRGAEFVLQWRQRRGRPASVRADAGVLLGQVAPARGVWAGQQAAFGQGGFNMRLSRDRAYVQQSANVRLDAGRTGGEAWQRFGLAVEGGAGFGEGGVTARFEQRSVYGSPAPFDRVLVGGVGGSILPGTVLAGRRLAPPVPLGTLAGDTHRALRLELRGAGLPLLFYERHRVRDRGAPWSDPLKWIGAEIPIAGGPLPLLFLPAFEATFGVARLLDQPAGPRTRWWAGIRWIP